MIRNENIPKMHSRQVFWGKLAKNGKSPERPIKPLTHSFTPRGLGTSLSSPKTFGTLEKPIPTISQLFPGKDWHDKKTLVMLFRAIERYLMNQERPAFIAGLLISCFVDEALYLVQFRLSLNDWLNKWGKVSEIDLKSNDSCNKDRKVLSAARRVRHFSQQVAGHLSTKQCH